MKAFWNSLRGVATPTAKKLLYKSGLIGIYHSIRNRRLLTVVIFHRVLPKNDSRQGEADPEWTVSDAFFKDCLQFFVKHYSVVSIANLLEFTEGARPLPARPLLITIDDGWSDTEEYAAHLLRQMNLPAVVFVVSKVVDGGEIWQETIRRLWRSESLRPRLLEQILDSTGERHVALSTVIEALSALAANKRETILETLREELGCIKSGEMLTSNQVRSLHARGYTIGSHGMTHTSITLAGDPWSELHESRMALARILGENNKGPSTLSFPNGRYNPDVVRIAGKAGYSCLFTSEAHLNSFYPGNSTPIVLGRIHISSRQYSDHAGRLRPDLLATSLFFRPVLPVGIPE